MPTPALDVLPEFVYVQRGLIRNMPELFINASAQGALQRDLGGLAVAGSRVGCYKLDRIVEIKVGITEVPQGTPPPSPPPEPVTT